MAIILTKREAAVYDMLKENYSRKAIAKLMSCTERTVETAIDNMVAQGVITRKQPLPGKPSKIIFTGVPFEVAEGKYRTRTGLNAKEKPKKPMTLQSSFPKLKGNYEKANGEVIPYKIESLSQEERERILAGKNSREIPPKRFDHLRFTAV